ncbi:MAG: ribosome small subunit-dependent GTPase A [Bacilli bacterium]|nr:ribosome small subunit-dependent GTPase A [Bacilli bacterium]
MDDLIIGIEKRKNILSRNKIDNTKNSSKLNDTIIATNIDLALIIASPNMPKLHPRFIDRYILILNKSQIDYRIVINKADLMDEESLNIIKEFKNRGLNIILTSTYTNEGIEDLKNIIKGKQVILVGQSGVGKSALANHLTHNENIASSHVGDKTLRGRHTTTKSSLYMIDDNSFIIDSPGIRAISIKHLNVDDIKAYFEEFNDYSCKYSNCLHLKEKSADCGVKIALNDGKISMYRYESYVKLIAEIK